MTDPSRITGTLIMEDRGARPDGRHNVLVFGVLAMSKADAEAYCRDRPEQSWVQGSAGGGIMRLGIAEGHNIAPSMGRDECGEPNPDLDTYYRSCTVDSLITSPIWRV